MMDKLSLHERIWKMQLFHILGRSSEPLNNLPFSVTLSYLFLGGGLNIGELVTLDEIKRNMSRFAKNKSPGPNSWTVEFFS